MNKRIRNIEIREALKRKGVFHWEIADALGIHETTFCVKLRKELPDTEKAKILSVIDSLAEEGGGRYE